MQIKDPAARGAPQSESILDDIEFSNGDRARMFADARRQNPRSRLGRWRRRWIGSIHRNRHPSHDGIDGDMVSHPAGAAGKDQLVLLFKAFERYAERVNGYALLDECSAVKDLRHEDLKEKRRLGRRPAGPRGSERLVQNVQEGPLGCQTSFVSHLTYLASTAPHPALGYQLYAISHVLLFLRRDTLHE